MCSFLFVLLCPGPRSTIEEDFHLVLSRGVNKNIVVPKKKYKLKLARPPSGKSLATPAPPTLCKRQLARGASYPQASILLALADTKACFSFPRIHPDLTGAFGFLINNFFCLAVAMVFGSSTLSSCWEPFRRVIEGLALKFANRPGLVDKHKKYISMIKWGLPCWAATKPVPAKSAN